MLDTPSSSQDEKLQDRFNRQVDEVITEHNTSLDYIKAIPNDGSITTVEQIIAYLKGL